MNRVVFLVLLLASLTAAPGAQQKPAPLAQPTFRTGIDLVPVDVVVLDNKGNPVTGLEAGDFTVTIDGQARRIVSAQYVQHAIVPSPPAGVPAPGAVAAPAPAMLPAPARTIVTNQEPPGRLVMIVVDGDGMDFGGTRIAIEGLKRLLATLGPDDLLGLAVLPVPGVAVPFTRDHGRLVEALTRVTGQAAPHVTVTHRQVGWEEALAYQRDKTSVEWKEAIDRECYSAAKDTDLYTECLRVVEGEAVRMLGEIRERVGRFRVGMANVLAYLQPMDAPKTVILLSSGIITNPIDREVDSLAREAAAARCSIYALHFNPADDIAPSERLTSPTRTSDAALGLTALDSLAGRTSGTVFDIRGQADTAFDRLAAELSGSYLLGVEPTASDRDGKAHEIHVEVARKSVTVRARREVVWVKRENAGARTPVDAVKAMLASPIPVIDVPIRVAAYAGPAPEAGKTRVLVSAEIGGDRTAAEQLTLGWALVGATAKAGVGGVEAVTLLPAAGRTSGPLSFVAASIVDPGDYTLHLAVVDRTGRSGSIAQAVEARLRPAGPLNVGDLVLSAPPTDAKSDFKPPVECVIEGDRLFVYLPVASADAQALAKATAALEIGRSEDDAPLMESTVPLIGSRPDQRALQVSIVVDLLPPGRYVVRVRLLVDEQVVATAARGFVIAPFKG